MRHQRPSQISFYVVSFFLSILLAFAVETKRPCSIPSLRELYEPVFRTAPRWFLCTGPPVIFPLFHVAPHSSPIRPGFSEGDTNKQTTPPPPLSSLTSPSLADLSSEEGALLADQYTATRPEMRFRSCPRSNPRRRTISCNSPLLRAIRSTFLLSFNAWKGDVGLGPIIISSEACNHPFSPPQA